MNSKYLLVILVFSMFSCGENEIIEVTEKPNILLIIADDMGKDATNGFSEGSIKPNTPNLENIRNEGLTFNNLWVYPTCSPTRASIITGKYGYRTGVKWAGDQLNQSEQILQSYINEQTNNSYATAIVGKWHLSGESSNVNPESFGLDYYSGLIRGAVQDYYQWQLTEGSTSSIQTEYITKVFADKSIEWINQQTKPWFLWLAFNAPHTPFHNPPMDMHSQGDLPEYTTDQDPMPYYLAAIEAMDYQIGQVLNNISEEEKENTIIIFIGDNGSPVQVAQSPYGINTSKGSLKQGGINVPMFVSGAGVARTGTDDNLICSTDLFCTISEIAGVNISEVNDSKSFKNLLTTSSSHRQFQYSEKDDGTDNSWTIRNEKYKLQVQANGSEEMYDLSVDPYENNDLLIGQLNSEQENAKSILEAELEQIRN